MRRKEEDKKKERERERDNSFKRQAGVRKIE